MAAVSSELTSTHCMFGSACTAFNLDNTADAVPLFPAAGKDGQ